jgi:hypothetical protein
MYGNPMDFDWSALDTLRKTYLNGTAGSADYWNSETLLSAYDATFARRIAWKWQWVFSELHRRGWQPPTSFEILDFGCGTGVAVREALNHWGPTIASGITLKDRSVRALRFAEAALAREHPGVPIRRSSDSPPGMVLVSHVLTELDAIGQSHLLNILRTAQSAIIVEPGTSDASHRLIALRDQLRADFNVIAPCTHRASCGMLTKANERHWCHFHASPPPEIFQDGDWMMFGKVMGIDLRALPLSFLVLDRRPAPPVPKDVVRVTGNPRFYKGYALLPGCTEAGVHERRFSRRTDTRLFRDLEKGRVPSLQHWSLDGTEITAVTPVTNPDVTSA